MTITAEIRSAIIARRAQGATLGQLAKEFSITRERARQITGERPDDANAIKAVIYTANEAVATAMEGVTGYFHNLMREHGIEPNDIDIHADIKRVNTLPLTHDQQRLCAYWSGLYMLMYSHTPTDMIAEAVGW